MSKNTSYSPAEEHLNILSHAIGFILSIIASILLVTHATRHGDIWHIMTFAIFGGSLALLYAASTSYHSAKTPKLRHKFRILDHAAIYILIAGTYTPFTLITLKGTLGWVLFGVAWGMALTGIVLKLFFTGRYNKTSTAMYIFMSWIVVVAIKPLIANLPIEGFFWLLGGGISYTIGAVFYSIERIKFNHAIFHLLVLIGSFCHFISVFNYVLPIN